MLFRSPSICPYCAVGCGQDVYVKDGRITDIEGDPDSPISRGRLCPKGAATFQLVTGSHRVHSVLYRLAKASGRLDNLERALVAPVPERRGGSSWLNHFAGRSLTHRASPPKELGR